MFWKLTSLSASSPLETLLDKENFTLEELLDEDDIIQECKALNSRLINFLRERAQVEQLLHYIIDEPPEDAESKRSLKYPFIACEVFTCEIDVILKTLVEEEGLMDLLFSFLEPTRPHSAVLAGYFSKVVVCLMLRKTVPLMTYVQSHQNVFCQLVDLIGITSIMEIMVRLVGADDHMYPNSLDVMQWLANSNLLEMIIDKLNPSSRPEVHANAAETLCAVTRNATSPLAIKLSSASFVSRIFDHALEDSQSKSSLVNSLSVCISLLDPKRSMPSPIIYAFRGQHMQEPPVQVSSETVDAMLPKLGDLLTLLNVSADDKVLPTTYGELKPPLGKYRLKIVEFIALLLKTGNEVAEKELVRSGTIRRVIDLFFEYPFNNALHHQVESIIFSCLESTGSTLLDNLFQDCGLVSKILEADKSSTVSSEANQPTLPASGRRAPRIGNLGHITRISNKLLQLGNTDSRIQAHLQGNSDWSDWQATVLQERNMVENVYRWACGRPTALHDRMRDSDDEDVRDRDYDVAALANNLSQAFRYGNYDNDNDDAEDGHGTLDRDDEETYFDDDSGEVVISSLRLGDDQGSSLFTNSNWFAFQDDRAGDAALSTSPNEIMDDINLNEAAYSGGNSSSDDEVVVGEDEELAESTDPANTASTFNNINTNVSEITSVNAADMDLQEEKPSFSGDTSIFRIQTSGNDDAFGDRPIPEWVGWAESSDFAVSGSSVNPFENYTKSSVDTASPADAVPTPVSGSLPNGTLIRTNSSEGSLGSDSSQRAPQSDDVEIDGVELEGSEKTLDQGLKDGIVGEAGPLKGNTDSKQPEKDADEKGTGLEEFNDANYWRVEQGVAVSE
ncbi:serine/threonine-protein phosphatase 6 regulatory subunit 3-like [Heracleum sosnowskyi]|uniref:Serine/threonine-protein phosphatase 6 regulatory subunit 3-like n=1 Tax=Heracleum sosnowskyi TaxID=360622 RepID=A0AAD8HW91_9APIA|nr:serine/threonine-protein phosphatase 6 regulatory subunit 3-like [Heracleum sosnowskyi]